MTGRHMLIQQNRLIQIRNLLPSNQRPNFLWYLNLPPIVVILHAWSLVAVHYTVVEALLAIPTVYVCVSNRIIFSANDSIKG